MKRIVSLSSIVSTLVLIAVLSFSSSTFAQSHGNGVVRPEPLSTDAIYFELGGPGIAYTFNYDHLFSQDWGMRVGVGGIGLTTTTIDAEGANQSSGGLLIVPVTASYFVSSHSNGRPGSSKLELGAGLFYAKLDGHILGQTYSSSGVGETAIIGYRYQPADGGFLFRAAFTPIVIESSFIPWFGLSAGYSF